MKYIDADRLRAEIERNTPFHHRVYIKIILDLIDYLQQEQSKESIAKEAVQLVFEEKLTPFKDGNQWSFLLGNNIQEGICGFGDTILDAAIAFYKDYSTTRIHIGELKKTMERPEVDLEKIIEQTYHDGSVADTDDMDHIYYRNIAHYFYELGKNSK